jgi:hypothetical protein
MAAKHGYHGSTIVFCRRNRVDDATEITRYENVGQRFEKGREASVFAGR